MKTNIANGLLNLGTVYAYGGKLGFGSNDYGMAINVPVEEGLYMVEALTNEYGEITTVQINLNNAAGVPCGVDTKEMIVAKSCKVFGDDLHNLTPDQKQERQNKQANKCIDLVRKFDVANINRISDIYKMLDRLCKELRLGQNGLLSLFLVIYRSRIEMLLNDDVLRINFDVLVAFLVGRGAILEEEVTF